MRHFAKFFPAVLVWLALSYSANAAVVIYSGPAIPIPTNFAGVSVDLETGGTSNDLEGLPGGDANFFLGGAGISNDGDETVDDATWQPVRTGTNNTDPVDNLTLDTTVGLSSTYSTGFGGSGGANSHFPPFVSGTSGYIGFSLEIAGPTTVYGWMRVTLQDDNTPGVIHEWAYEDTGAAILVGAIPEPGTGALALLGLGALALRRRR